jgi:hypothetical protein
LLVNEVCAVAAAALHELFSRTSQDALASVTENAGPVALQEGDVKNPGTFLVGIFKADPFMGL